MNATHRYITISINLTIVLYYKLYDRSLVDDKDSFLASEESYHYFISRLYLPHNQYVIQCVLGCLIDFS